MKSSGEPIESELDMVIGFVVLAAQGETLSSLLMVLPILGIAALVFLSYSWHFARSRQLLERWAEAHGYYLLQKEYRTFQRGPFFWSTSKAQTVYFVKLNDHGTIREGWVRCGGWWGGLFADQVEVRWESERD